MIYRSFAVVCIQQEEVVARKQVFKSKHPDWTKTVEVWQR